VTGNETTAVSPFRAGRITGRCRRLFEQRQRDINRFSDGDTDRYAKRYAERY
jgi:hypothetical protein